MAEGQYLHIKKPDQSGADIAKEIRARVSDINQLVRQAAENELLVSYSIAEVEEHEGCPHLIVTVAQEV